MTGASWKSDQIKAGLEHSFRGIIKSPFSAASFRQLPAEKVHIIIYFDIRLDIGDSDIEEIEIAITELYSQTSRNKDIGEISYSLAGFSDLRISSDSSEGYVLLSIAAA